MLWLMSIVTIVVGGVKICYHTKDRSKICICIIILELILVLALRWCFNTPTKGKILKHYDVTETDMLMSKDSFMFSGINETIPYTLRDISSGYTICLKTDSSTAVVEIYEEKFSTIKFLLGFKPKQNIFKITYNNGNKIY